MKPEELEYEKLKTFIGSFEEKGRSEARSFLNWFLENIYRLDPVDADDCICDKANDRGIDGIYVDGTQEEILVFQGKIRQKKSSIGDGPLRELAGTLTQFENAEAVDALLNGGGNDDLKSLLSRLHIKDLVENGYRVVGAFVSNQPLDANGREFSRQHGRIRVYDRNRIASEFLDIEAEAGVEDVFRFDLSYIDPLIITTRSGVKSIILPVQAKELVMMSGIKASVHDRSQHQFFPLYHNGVTILCASADIRGEALYISNYVVVNGAQSITTFKRTEESLSDDLRVIAKIIELSDQELAKAITVNSNNQNAIKPRDLKSTNEIQVRLRREFEIVLDGRFDLEIKRGQEARAGSEVITNEEAGRLLLAFDLMEPESCHQVYKLFDEKYAEIFARPAVTAYRIAFLHMIMNTIVESMPSIEYKPLSKYGLTRFFILSVLRDLFYKDERARQVMQDPKSFLNSDQVVPFFDEVKEALGSLIVDLNYEVRSRGDNFDYKGDLKSPSKIRELRSELLKSYEKELAKGKIRPIGAVLKVA